MLYNRRQWPLPPSPCRRKGPGFGIGGLGFRVQGVWSSHSLEESLEVGSFGADELSMGAGDAEEAGLVGVLWLFGN